MTTRKILLVLGALVGVGATFYYAYGQYRLLVDKWDYGYDDFRISSYYPNLVVSFDFTFKNPSAIKATIRDLSVKVFSDDIYIGEISHPEEITVAGATPKSTLPAETKLPINISVESTGIGTQITRLLSAIAAKQDLPLKFVGQARIKTPFGWIKFPIGVNTSAKELYTLYRYYYP